MMRLFRVTTRRSNAHRAVLKTSLRSLATLSGQAKIIYTKTDEAPALATYSLLPIVNSFVSASGINLEAKDISVAARILALFPERLRPEQQVPDNLAELGELAKKPEANIIKLPNISASEPQLIAAIKELQSQGYNIPDYPESPKNAEEEKIKALYGKVKGSAVNPVLREGNSDRRAPEAVKAYARANPHKMGKWEATSKTHVATMTKGDFFENEKSWVAPEATTATIQFVGQDGSTKDLFSFPVQKGEVVDGTFMNVKELKNFYREQVAAAKEEGVLFSLHLKATMMKVSDPIMFGHCVEAYFAPLFEKYGDVLKSVGVDTRNGFGDVLKKIEGLPADQKAEIEECIKSCYENGPEVAMVNSHKGITNLHVPSDVIVDASMPAMIRDSGKMWDANDKMKDCKAVIPDRCYSGVYDTVVNFCKKNGAFDPVTMGTVPNVGLMAQAAEEYGSHNKTFTLPADGTMRVVDANGQEIFSHQAEEGDIWRACQTKDAPIRDWVKLAVTRARDSGAPAVFWLNPERAHDTNLIAKVTEYLKDHDTNGLDIQILPPAEACLLSCQRAKDGKDTISCTGNVLRDYNTDLFPILELNTSAKMLSIVPLMEGGGLFETGAGGSAPKHVQQFEQEGHLRWDSLGEFLALAESLQHVATMYGSADANVYADTLRKANAKFLLENKNPKRVVKQLDNRGSHFYLAMYWAQELAKVSDASLASRFSKIAAALEENEQSILQELTDCQGTPQDVGGYFNPDFVKATAAMRPSALFNKIIEM